MGGERSSGGKGREGKKGRVKDAEKGDCGEKRGRMSGGQGGEGEKQCERGEK